MSSESPIWDAPRELGSGPALSSIGGTPVAVLGGFAFSTEIQIVSQRPTFASDVAVVLLSLAVAAFIISLLWISEAGQYQVDPGVRLTWAPEARFQQQAIERVRLQQRQDEWLLDLYSRRIASANAIGIVATLAGVCFVLFAARHTWGVVVASLFLAASITFVFLDFLGKGGIRLFPRPADWRKSRKPPQPLTDEQRDMLR